MIGLLGGISLAYLAFEFIRLANECGFIFFEDLWYADNLQYIFMCNRDIRKNIDFS